MLFYFSFPDHPTPHGEIQGYCQPILQNQRSVLTAESHKVPVYVNPKTAYCFLCWTDPSLSGPDVLQAS